MIAIVILGIWALVVSIMAIYAAYKMMTISPYVPPANAENPNAGETEEETESS